MSANTKNIILNHNVSGQTIYSMIIHENDGNKALTYFDYSDGAFKAIPTTPYIPLAEDSVMKCLYTKAESQAVWPRGKMIFKFFIQAGVNPAPATDEAISLVEDETWIENDAL